MSVSVYAEEYNHRALRHLKSAVEHLMNGEYENAIEECTNVIRIDPESAVTYVMRARAYFELGNMDRAIADSTEAIRRDRNNAGAYSIRGSANAAKGNIERAVADWNAVLRINPQAAEAAANIEKVRQQRGL
jgi:tetratricopeptide (TPR) repeat protein